MKNELGPDEHIEEFVAGCPKNYTFKIVNVRHRKRRLCKLRGITPNHSAAQLVNFDSIRDMILGTEARDVITVRTDRKIKRKMRRCDGSGQGGIDTVTIVFEPKENVYRVSFHKCRRLDDFDSVPFGTIKDEQSRSVRV
jgi:hypothetical protein